MVLLDTNVISEFTRAEPDAKVLGRIDLVDRTHLFTTAITEAEIRHGLEMMPEGRRKRAIERIVLRVFETSFAGRILSFDSAAAQHFASILTGRLKQGRPMSFGDAQIAAIARCYGATLCTRNARDFVDCGVPVWNPWTVDLEERT